MKQRDILLRHPLRQPVRGYRISRRFLRAGIDFRIPVHRPPGRGKNELVNSQPPRRVQQPQRPDDIHLHIIHRILRRTGHAGLRRQMKHQMRLLPVENIQHPRLGNIGVVKSRPLVQIPQPPPAQVVNNDHLIPLRQQPIHQMRPDKPGAPGNQRLQSLSHNQSPPKLPPNITHPAPPPYSLTPLTPPPPPPAPPAPVPPDIAPPTPAPTVYLPAAQLSGCRTTSAAAD